MNPKPLVNGLQLPPPPSLASQQAQLLEHLAVLVVRAYQLYPELFVTPILEHPPAPVHDTTEQ